MATGQGPQAAKRPRGRPRKHPAPDPAAPKRPRGRPRKQQLPAQEPTAAELTGPPEVEPDAVEIDAMPCDETGRPLSLMWSILRSRYDPGIRKELEEIMRLGALELGDLVWLELAEHQEMGRLLAKASDRYAEKLVSARQQSRKQVMRILVERGPVGGVNGRNVRVPDGLSLEELTRPPDLGDDVLAEPDIDRLPKRYQDAARASITPVPR